jgi:hypothetical protein
MSIEVLYVQATAMPGTHISEAFRQAALMALQEKRQVQFDFNGKTYRASCSEILDLIEGTAKRNGA